MVKKVIFRTVLCVNLLAIGFFGGVVAGVEQERSTRPNVCENLFNIRDKVNTVRRHIVEEMANHKNKKGWDLRDNYQRMLGVDSFNTNRQLLLLDCIKSYKEFKI